MREETTIRTIAAGVLAAALLVPATAEAITYPEPQEPGKVAAKPKGPFKTRTVCRKKGRCDFRSIQKAINASHAGDTVRVRPGVYHEGVAIVGRKKAYLKLIGDPKHPARVVLDGKGLKGAAVQNGVRIDGADQVTVRGFKARRYKGNGFFAVNVVGYRLQNLIAERTGVYGIYAFNSKGGLMADDEAYYVNDGAFYIGQTPPQAKPIRSVVRNVKGWGSPLGFSGTNMRYVTIKKSKFFNNALGIAPNALDSEKYPPAEDNVIVDNDIFWNNFNFHKGAPFVQPKSGTAPLVPVGTGIILLGGRGNVVTGNRIYGNYLTGIAMIEGILLQKNPQARALENNEVRDNEFGLGGNDLNGREVIYDGSGSGNCFAGNSGLQNTMPATLPGCPFSGQNAFSKTDQDTMIGWTGERALNGWIKHPHASKPGYKPLETWPQK